MKRNCLRDVSLLKMLQSGSCDCWSNLDFYVGAERSASLSGGADQLITTRQYVCPLSIGLALSCPTQLCMSRHRPTFRSTTGLRTCDHRA